MAKRTLLQRFQDKYVPEVTSGCWLWAASCGADGYGRIYATNGPKLAHRISYELHVGPIPDGLLVLHDCDTPACVNFEHLFLGSNADNSADMIRKGRSAFGERHPSVKEKRRKMRMLMVNQCLAKATQISLTQKRYRGRTIMLNTVDLY